MAREAKRNPKVFYKHSQSKLKTKSGRCNLQVKNDTKASTPKDKAEILNKFLVVSSLIKILADMPEFTAHTDYNRSNIIFTPDLGQHKLQQLNVKESPGLDKMQPRVLKES